MGPLITVKVDKDVLNNAKMASFNRLPTTQRAMHWLGALVQETLDHENLNAPRKRQRRAKDLQAFSEAVSAFAADLLLHSGNALSEGFMYRPFDRAKLAETFVSGTNFESLVTYWNAMGLLEITPFIITKTDFLAAEVKGYAKVRRFRATERFLEQAQEWSLSSDSVVSNFTTSLRRTELVQLAGTKKTENGQAKKADLVQGGGPKFQAEVSRVRMLNGLMRGYRYSLSDIPMVRRLFHCAERPDFDYNLGGRLYCASQDDWMTMSKQERSHITIEGQPTCEVDVSASHLSILYALLDEKVPNGDLYAGLAYPRHVVKGVLVSALGSGKLPTRWPRGFSQKYYEDTGHKPGRDYKLKTLVQDLTALHPVLNKLEPGKLDWANLQFEEAECFLSAMFELHQTHKVPSLPVHDSLIVQRQHREIAKKVLSRSYLDRLGFVPRISDKTTPRLDKAA
ncbi:MAG: hypothetical protein ACSHWZ_17505 [Sulfitobacter sp.]